MPAGACARPGVCVADSSREALRRRLLDVRRAQAPELAARRAREAQERLMAAPCWQEAQSVALYAGVRDELATNLLLREAWASGREVWLPRVMRGSRGRMEFVRCQGADDLQPGAFGLLEPRPELPGACPEDAAFCPELILVPGVAFDRHGKRMGYGGGFYDRFLGALTSRADGRCPSLGFCFGFQLVEAVPSAPWDRPMDGICTEGELFWTSH